MSRCPAPLAVPAGRRGFTLPEAVATLAILSLLVAFGMANLQRHLDRGWRLQVRAAMIDAMLVLQRHAMAAGTYADPGTERPFGAWPRLVPEPPASARYRIDAMACPGASLHGCVQLRARALRAGSDNGGGDDGGSGSGSGSGSGNGDCTELILRSTGEWLQRREDEPTAQPGPGAC
ncbi:type II secretion system protein [Paracidovorax citrulli]